MHHYKFSCETGRGLKKLEMKKGLLSHLVLGSFPKMFFPLLCPVKFETLQEIGLPPFP